MKKGAGRKLYSLREAYGITLQALRTMPELKRAKKQGELDQPFIERIMLAVTEVNGCALCSYAHAKMALEAGLSDTEIRKMLSGSSDDVPDDELQAILFAQSYADARGTPSEKAWERVVETYGLPKAMGILGAVRVIMMGNVYGIPWSAFLGRLKGKPDERSSLAYELGMITGSILFLPVVLPHTLLSRLRGAPLARF
jgi:AhpD family alkylhydroperoxidase